MTYIDTSDTGQGAKLKNQDILGCLFLCLKYPIAKGFCKILFFYLLIKYRKKLTICEYNCECKLCYQT